MPYIKKDMRKALDGVIKDLFDGVELTRGEVNYCMTKIIHLWVLQEMKRISSKVKKYHILNDAYGIICCVAAEFYSVVVTPYEKLKRQDNGAISQLDRFADGADTPQLECGQCGFIFVKVEKSRLNICPNCGKHDHAY